MLANRSQRDHYLRAQALHLMGSIVVMDASLPDLSEEVWKLPDFDSRPPSAPAIALLHAVLRHRAHPLHSHVRHHLCTWLLTPPTSTSAALARHSW